MPRAGIVGVGNMGGAIALRLLDCGWQVQVCDLEAAKVAALAVHGAVACATPSRAAEGADALIVCVVDAAQSHEVLFGTGGASETLRPGQVVLLCPTIAPHDVERLAAALAQRGIDTLDAPMSGGPARARDGSMSLMVAGPQAVVDRCRRLLDALSARLFLVGARCGDGARTKLVNNLLAGINLVGAAEALALASRLGLDAARTLQVIEQSSGQSWIGTDRMRRALSGDHAPRAHLALLEKDTRLAMEAAAAAGFQGPLGGAARDAFAQAAAAGLRGADDGALLAWIAGLHTPGGRSS